MALARVQVILQGISGLPEDRFMNTLSFNGDGLPDMEDWLQTIAEGVAEAWRVTLHGTTGSGPFFPASTVQRGFSVRAYDAEDPGGPPQVVDATFSGNSSVALPTEVASVLSFVAGSNRGRNRGRIFVGPLSANAIDAGNNARLSAACTASLRLLGQQLEALGGSSVIWSVFSRADNVHRAVTGGWTDNAPDTQRRRGVTSSLRVPWEPL